MKVIWGVVFTFGHASKTRDIENMVLVRQANIAAKLKLASNDELTPRLTDCFIWNNLIQSKSDHLSLAQVLPSKAKETVSRKALN